MEGAYLLSMWRPVWRRRDSHSGFRTELENLIGSPDCTPGYYNNEGQPGPEGRLNVGYPAGPSAYFKYLDAWRKSGAFDGLAFA